MLERYIQKVRGSLENNLQPFRQKKAALQNYHRTQRQDLLKKQEERRKEEEKEYYQRLPKGFRALWSRVSGKYKKIKVQNEGETERCKVRDREDKQAMIDRQLTQRQNLQEQVKPILRNHQKLIIQLKKDVAQYMEMRDPAQKDLQRKLNHIALEEQLQKKIGQAHDCTQEI
ncbi:MAG: hypothetical protein NPIRA04_35740 [Nitrospirales bacterium]|nr:MAG: hypothetical protein NPIRA04_35740 [Nitrospirales bacterium]